MVETANISTFNSSIDLNVIERMFGDSREFTHRGKTCKQRRLKSFLMAAIENNREVTPSDTVIAHSTAVEAVLSAAKNKYPEWFDQTECDQPTSDRVLSKSAIKARYFGGTLDPSVINAASYDDVADVVIPLMAIMFEDLEEQQVVDKKEAIEAGQREIRQAIYDVALNTDDLGVSDIQEATTEAIAELDEHGLTD